MTDTLKPDDQTMVFGTLWAIWHARRKAIHEQLYQSPLSTYCFVQRFVNDLQLSRQKKEVKPATEAHPAPGWLPPPQGMIKINVDAAVGKNTSRGSVAVIARSDTGVFMGASVVVFPGKTEPETLEALACREAVSLAYDIHARSVRVASDCLNVIRSLELGTQGVYAHIAREIKEAKGNFEALVFSHEKRTSNKEAHRLARSAVVDDPGRQVWLINPPGGLSIPVIVEF
jgi:ribonuclease HI